MLMTLLRVPDEYSGELPMAFIALTEDAVQRVKQDPSASSGIKTAVAKFVADSLTKYKHLKGGVEIVDEIPKNPRYVAPEDFFDRSSHPIV
jgi:4-coumarate--CoA ligase